MVLRKVESCAFCLGGLDAPELNLYRGGSWLEDSPLTLLRQDSISEDGVDNVLYGTVAKIARSSRCAELSTVPGGDGLLGMAEPDTVARYRPSVSVTVALSKR
jgi:hypothetical protein